ncbi:MAG TPA: hypothetical protein VEK08_21615 [Planctomycetota bacterium]|nr:hypothetical protein [Planctomycetota bacterium]
MKRCFLPLLLACALCFSEERPQKAGVESWPAPVPGFTPPAPGEHPRLFFRKADLPELKKRSETPEGKAILSRLKATLGGGESMPATYNPARKAYEAKAQFPEGTYSISHAAGFGMLYQLTGDKKYAELGKECFEKAFAGQRDRDGEARYSWSVPGGQLRAGPSLAWYALGYDLCYEGWDEEFRRKVAGAIQNYAPGDSGKEGNMALKEMVLKTRHMPASNHWGSIIGGCGIALLAIKGDPGTDAALTEKHLAEIEKKAIQAMTQGFGDGGFFPEGQGPSHMASNPALIPFFQAMKVAGGKDFISPRPNVQWLSLRWIHELIPDASGKPLYPCRVGGMGGSYGTENFLEQQGGMSHGGWFSQGMGLLTDSQKQAMLWTYDNVVRKADADRYDSVNYPHRAILALINWPIGEQAKNPEGIVPKVRADTVHSYFGFRNRWQDADDSRDCSHGRRTACL